MMTAAGKAFLDELYRLERESAGVLNPPSRCMCLLIAALGIVDAYKLSLSHSAAASSLTRDEFLSICGHAYDKARTKSALSS